MARRSNQTAEISGLVGGLVAILLGLTASRLNPALTGFLLALSVVLVTSYAWSTRTLGGAPGRRWVTLIAVVTLAVLLGESVWPRALAGIHIDSYRTYWKDVAGGKQVFFYVTIINDGDDAKIQEYYQHAEGPTDDPYGSSAQETFVKPVVEYVRDRLKQDGGIAPTPMDAKATQHFTVPGPILPIETQRAMADGKYAIYVGSGVLVRRADGESSKVFCGVYQGGEIMGCSGAP